MYGLPTVQEHVELDKPSTFFFFFFERSLLKCGLSLIEKYHLCPNYSSKKKKKKLLFFLSHYLLLLYFFFIYQTGP